MENIRKAAYRDMLYEAMLAIRDGCKYTTSESWNPLEWRRQYRRNRIAEATADWLHNLAWFSARDFDGFDEDYFWREHSRLCNWYPSEMERYRWRFDDSLKEAKRFS